MNSLLRDVEAILAAVGLFQVIQILASVVFCHCGKLRIWCWYTMRRYRTQQRGANEP